jgi:hypothetical protein
MYIGVGKKFRQAAALDRGLQRDVLQAVRRVARNRGLGTVSTPVAGSLVFSSNPVGNSFLRRPAHGWPVSAVPVAAPISTPIVGPAYPVWGGNPPGPASPSPLPWQSGGANGPGWQGNPTWTAAGSPYGSQPTSQSLAVAQALLATNPGLLSQSQWTLLQQAGLVSSTLPYSSAGLVTPTAGSSVASSSAIDPATGVPYATELAAAQAGSTSTDLGTTLSADYGGLPLYAWLAGGGLLVYMLMGRKGR